MNMRVEIKGNSYEIDMDHYHDLSSSLRHGSLNPNAYHIGEPEFSPFCIGSFVGAVSEGGACNCEDIKFNAHGNGTHTECIGHITSERISVKDSLKDVWISARLITATPQQNGNNQFIDRDVLNHVDLKGIDALVLRTTPNDDSKQRRMWSGSNPPYITPEFMTVLVEADVQHFLLDLPSVDPEMDEGKLVAHKTFWNYPENPRMNATISEMIYVPNDVPDGLYLLNLQIAPFHSDASPSRPLLFPLSKLK